MDKLQVNKKAGIPVVRFTPEYYKKAYRELRAGSWANVIEMMNRAETDAHVAGCLEGRRAGVYQEFVVKPFEDGNTKDEERAAWWNQYLRKLKPFKLFESIQEARLKKFKVIDFEWEVIDSKLVPVSFISYEQKYFRYDFAGDKKLKIDYGKNLVEIPPTALVCETDQLPKMFPVVKEYILKEFGVESWASFLETFGEPLILGLYPPGAGQEVKDEIATAVEDLARSSRGTMPDTGVQEMLKIIETHRNTSDHSVFDARCDRKIAIALLGHANAVEQSQGMQIGENLTQYKVKREVAVGDMYFIDECIEQFTKIVFDLNFADGRYSIFEMDKKPPVNVREMLDVVDTAFQHGVEIQPENYQLLGLKLSDEQESVKKENIFGGGLP